MLRIVMFASLLVATAACRTKFQPQTVEVHDPGPPERVLPTIRVLDPGMTPRVPLRYRVAPGHVEVLYVELARGQTTRAGDQGMQGGIPPVQLQVELGPAQPTPQGYIRHPVKVTQVRLSHEADQMSPAQREQVERSLAPLLEVQGWSEMDIQGRIRTAEFKGLEDVSPTLRTMLGSIRSALLTVSFPEEPLGPRARWEVERKMQFSGVWVDQIMTYSIDKMDRQQLWLQVTGRQTAAPQATDSGRLEAYQASVVGSAVVRLENFTPYSEAETVSQMRIMAPSASGPQLVQVDARMLVKLYPADAADAAKTQDAEGPSKPDDDVPTADDAKIITDPGKQKLKWQ